MFLLFGTCSWNCGLLRALLASVVKSFGCSPLCCFAAGNPNSERACYLRTVALPIFHDPRVSFAS